MHDSFCSNTMDYDVSENYQSGIAGNDEGDKHLEARDRRYL